MVTDKSISRATVIVTEPDFDRLQALARSPRYRSTHARLLMDLRAALDHAEVVGAGQVPRDVVTMRSRVRMRDLRSADLAEYTLVYPDEADLDAGKLSVLAPMGMAMLGSWVAQVVRFDAPAGQRRLKIDQILYQPESSGDLHL